MYRCGQCGLFKTDVSKAQLKKPISKRRCTSCVPAPSLFQDLKNTTVNLTTLTTGGRGLVAAKNLKTNDIILEVPLERCITAEPAPESAQIKSTFSLTRWLLVEAYKGKDSKWAAYISKLPLTYENIRPPRHKLDTSLYTTAFNIRHMMFMADRKLVDPQYHRHYEWAFRMINSRVFTNDGVATVVPVADMCNHSSTEPNVGYTFKDGKFVCWAKRFIRKGQELLINYSNKGNTLYMLNYGFRVPSNPYNQCQIFIKTDMKLPRRTFDDGYVNYHMLPENPRVVRFQLPFPGFNTPILRALFGLLRLLVATPDERGDHVFPCPYLNPSNERATCMYLMQACTQRINELKLVRSTIIDDEINVLMAWCTMHDGTNMPDIYYATNHYDNLPMASLNNT